MHGGAFTAHWLKEQGVTHVFALSGEHVLPLLDGLADAGIDVIACLSARMKNWQTRTFPEMTCEHHRPMGTGNQETPAGKRGVSVKRRFAASYETQSCGR